MEQPRKTPTDSNGIPQVPPPQTVSGCLEQEGIPFNPIPLSSVALTKELCSSFWRHVATKPVSTQQGVGETLHVAKPFVIGGLRNPHLFQLPFQTSIYWKGSVTWRFWAIKPDRVVGKIAFAYHPETDSATLDTARREPYAEWDLSESDYFDITFQGYNNIFWRPVVPQLNTEVDKVGYQRYAVHTPAYQYRAGTFQAYISAPIQVGNVFPQDFKILIFARFDNPQTATITDFRQDVRSTFYTIQ